MSSLLVRDVRVVVTMDDDGRELQGTSILIENGWITRIDRDAASEEADQIIDGTCMIAVPGLINTHHHLYQMLTRGFPESDGKPLFEWLQMLYPIWAGLDEDMISISTEAGLAELALSGCTTCADHLYVFPSDSDGFIDAQVAAAARAGVRFHPTRGSMDLGISDGGLPPDDVIQPREIILRESERVVERYHDPSPGAMVRVGLAPCSPFSATPELMLETAGLAREHGVRLHTHLAETRDEEAYSRRTFGVSPVELLDRVSWLEEDVWLAHCVHLTASDMTTMASRHVSIAHCPTSNMLLGSGLAPIPQLQAAGVTVGLGVDGSASNDANDLRQEVKQAMLSARVRDGAEALSARDALWMATRGGAACLGRDDVGRLEIGKAGDLALFDLDSLPCAGGAEDPVGALVLGAPRAQIVIVDGVVIVRDGKLTRGDQRELAARLNEASGRLLCRWRDRR